MPLLCYFNARIGMYFRPWADLPNIDSIDEFNVIIAQQVIINNT